LFKTMLRTADLKVASCQSLRSTICGTLRIGAKTARSITLGQFSDGLWHRRGKQQGLTLPRQQPDDALEGVDEAKVEHPVGLVEDEDLHAGQEQRAPLNQVEQPPWRGGEEYLDDPASVAATPVATTAERVDQRVVLVPTERKRDLLATLLRDPALTRVLVFTRTKHGADGLA